MEIKYHNDIEEVKSFSVPFEVKSDGDGVIEGYASTFGNVDSYGDIIEKGAFVESLALRRPAMLWQHNMDDPIGVWPEYREDDAGLFVRGKIITEASRGRDAYHLVKGGALNGLSIGFRVEDYEMRGNNRIIKKMGLYEVSIVTIGANDKARIREIRMQKLAAGVLSWREMDEASIERLVRGALQLSRNEAKAYHSGGFKGLLDLRDVGEAILDANQREVEAVKSQLEQLFRSLAK